MSLSFTLAAGGYRYRALRLRDPALTGWDVYALQTALVAVGSAITVDGVFGEQTSKAVLAYQPSDGLEADGVAGVLTQRALCLRIGRIERDRLSLPVGLLKGQIEHESSFWVGNHTPPYPNGSRDVGVVQRNTEYTVVEHGFNIASIKVLAARIAEYHAKHVSWGVTGRRAWELAAGSWNAPAWTDRIAKGGSLSASQREHIEEYIDDVTVYVRDWSP